MVGRDRHRIAARVDAPVDRSGDERRAACVSELFDAARGGGRENRP